jgi:hypothetical protein
VPLGTDGLDLILLEEILRSESCKSQVIWMEIAACDDLWDMLEHAAEKSRRLAEFHNLLLGKRIRRHEHYDRLWLWIRMLGVDCLCASDGGSHRLHWLCKRTEILIQEVDSAIRFCQSRSLPSRHHGQLQVLQIMSNLFGFCSDLYGPTKQRSYGAAGNRLTFSQNVRIAPNVVYAKPRSFSSNQCFAKIIKKHAGMKSTVSKSRIFSIFVSD